MSLRGTLASDLKAHHWMAEGFFIPSPFRARWQDAAFLLSKCGDWSLLCRHLLTGFTLMAWLEQVQQFHDIQASRS